MTVAETHVVRGEILDMRADVSGQHCGADIRHEQIFRRRVHHVRSACDQHVDRTPGRPHGPDGVHIPPGDQVHVPQVRPVRHRAETRLAVRAALEHRQRKDLHIHMVLVHRAVVRAGPHGRPQVRMSRRPDGVSHVRRTLG